MRDDPDASGDQRRRWIRQAGRGAAGLVVGALVYLLAVSADARAASIRWHPCPQYSERTFKFLAGPEELEEFKQLWRRTQCGSIRVPLDYGKPHGRKIEIALTRLRATDPAHRLGALAVNPGGPGGSGYLMPLGMVTAHRNGNGARLNERFDLIGFDPRGVGYSTKVDCRGARPPRQGPGPLTEEHARKVFETIERSNRRCVKQAPAFLAQLTTANIARDLDQIRHALHERRISFLGVSWGSLLGAAYRSLFPTHVERMWLDSPAGPNLHLDDLQAGRAKAMEESFARFAAWVAARNSVFGLGTSATEVTAVVTRLRAELDVNPRIYSDMPDVPIDGTLVAEVAGGFTLSWPLAAPLLKALHDAPSGTKAPREVRQAFRGMAGGDAPDADEPRPPADLPEDSNPTMHVAVLCNEFAGGRHFASAWSSWQELLRRYPITGQAGNPGFACAGWTLPVQRLPLRRTRASLVMSAHRYEIVSPYVWGVEMLHAIGGRLLTVVDGVHGSTSSLESKCSPKISVYFLTGRLRGRRCQGVPVPPEERAPPPG